MQSQYKFSQRLEMATQEFAARMAAWHGISDGSLSARIVGEFSAGKTRVLSAVLGDIVPEKFVPVSSREVQTRLPLEVTYGEQPALCIVKRATDTEVCATVVRHLDHFPGRQEVEQIGCDPQQYRLRLSLPLSNLVLPQGDFFHDSKTPKRLFLIDMPGWNSGDDELAEEDASVVMAGRLNLALVYVVNASRLDSLGNARRLATFMTVMADVEFVSGSRLLLVITHCGGVELERTQARAARQILDIWTGMGLAPEDLTLTVLGVEFDDMTPPQLQAFRTQFWQSLLAPIGSEQQTGHPWTVKIHAWGPDWQLAPKIQSSHTLLVRLRAAVALARQSGAFMPGMNMRRLDGLNRDEILSRLRQIWERQTHCHALSELGAGAATIALNPDHPLAPWWAEFWQAQTDTMQQAVQQFFDCVDQALQEVTADTADLALHLHQRLADPHAVAVAAVHGSFARLVDTLMASPPLPPEKLLATVLSLVALQSHFEVSCASQMQLLQGGAA